MIFWQLETGFWQNTNSEEDSWKHNRGGDCSCAASAETATAETAALAWDYEANHLSMISLVLFKIKLKFKLIFIINLAFTLPSQCEVQRNEA